MDPTDLDEAIPDGLTKLTVYLTTKSRVALDSAAELTELTKTDTVNRALQLYWTLQTAANGAIQLGNERGVTFTVDELQGDSFNFVITVRFVPDAEAGDPILRRRWWWWPW